MSVTIAICGVALFLGLAVAAVTVFTAGLAVGAVLAHAANSVRTGSRDMRVTHHYRATTTTSTTMTTRKATKTIAKKTTGGDVKSEASCEHRNSTAGVVSDGLGWDVGNLGARQSRLPGPPEDHRAFPLLCWTFTSRPVKPTLKAGSIATTASRSTCSAATKINSKTSSWRSTWD